MSDSDFTLALTAILLFGTFAGMIVYVIYIYTYDIIVKYKTKGLFCAYILQNDRMCIYFAYT